MNAYKYQKFLEGLNNLRGIAGLLAPRLRPYWLRTLAVVCVVWDLYSPSVRRGLERPLTQSQP